MNTSFNVRGEPIVCTPADAYACFMRTDIDDLVLGTCLLEKANAAGVEGDRAWRSNSGSTDPRRGSQVRPSRSAVAFLLLAGLLWWRTGGLLRPCVFGLLLGALLLARRRPRSHAPRARATRVDGPGPRYIPDHHANLHGRGLFHGSCADWPASMRAVGYNAVSRRAVDGSFWVVRSTKEQRGHRTAILLGDAHEPSGIGQ